MSKVEHLDRILDEFGPHLHDAPYDGFTMVTCDTNDPYTPALLWALVPAVLMAGVILTMRWFFPPKPM